MNKYTKKRNYKNIETQYNYNLLKKEGCHTRNQLKKETYLIYKKRSHKKNYLIKTKNVKRILINKKKTNLKIEINKPKYKCGTFIEQGKRIGYKFKNTWSNSIEETKKKNLYIQKNNNYNIPQGCITTVKNNQIIKKSTNIIVYKCQNKKTKDITQGLTKVEEILENKKAMKNKLNNKLRKEYRKYKFKLDSKIALEKTINKTQNFIIKKLQHIYSSQNVVISDKHFEIIIKQMTSKVIVTKTSNCKLICGELIDKKKAEKINKNTKRITYRPIILGIKKYPNIVKASLQPVASKKQLRYSLKQPSMGKLTGYMG